MSVYLRGSIWWCKYNSQGKVIRVSTQSRDKWEALKFEKRLNINRSNKTTRKIHDDLPEYKSADEWRAIIESESGRRFVTKLHIQIASRSRKKGFESYLTRPQLARLITCSQGLCDVTSLPLCIEKSSIQDRAYPWKLSIDRINSHDGYLLGNVRVVSYDVNIALGQFGDEVLDIICDAIASRDDVHQMDVIA